MTGVYYCLVPMQARYNTIVLITRGLCTWTRTDRSLYTAALHLLKLPLDLKSSNYSLPLLLAPHDNASNLQLRVNLMLERTAVGLDPINTILYKIISRTQQ